MGDAQRREGEDPTALMERTDEREMLPLCRAEGIGVIPWSPLGRGVLARPGNRDPGERTERAKTDTQIDSLYAKTADQDALVIEAVRKVAARHDKPMAQIAYGWVASRPGVTSPIVGISKLAQFDDALAALEIKLSDDDVAELEAPYRPKPPSGHV